MERSHFSSNRSARTFLRLVSKSPPIGFFFKNSHLKPSIYNTWEPRSLGVGSQLRSSAPPPRHTLGPSSRTGRPQLPQNSLDSGMPLPPLHKLCGHAEILPSFILHQTNEPHPVRMTVTLLHLRRRRREQASTSRDGFWRCP